MYSDPRYHTSLHWTSRFAMKKEEALFLHKVKNKVHYVVGI